MWSASFLSGTLFRPAWNTRWLVPGRRTALNAAKGLRENWNGRVGARSIQLCSAISVFSPRRWDLVSLPDAQWQRQHFPYWCSSVYPFFPPGSLAVAYFPLHCAHLLGYILHCFFFHLFFISMVLSQNGVCFSSYKLLFKWCARKLTAALCFVKFENSVWKTASQVPTIYSKYES